MRKREREREREREKERQTDRQRQRERESLSLTKASFFSEPDLRQDETWPLKRKGSLPKPSLPYCPPDTRKLFLPRQLLHRKEEELFFFFFPSFNSLSFRSVVEVIIIADRSLDGLYLYRLLNTPRVLG